LAAVRVIEAVQRRQGTSWGDFVNRATCFAEEAAMARAALPSLGQAGEGCRVEEEVKGAINTCGLFTGQGAVEFWSVNPESE
jgi:hypothetical protein